MIPKQFYQEALNSQDACNLSGIVRSFARATEALWDHAREIGEGTNFVNEHPISRLYAEQICHLSGAGSTSCWQSYASAYHLAHEEIEKDEEVVDTASAS